MMIVNTENPPGECRAYAAGLNAATDVVEYWLADHAWWKFWMLPHTIRTALRGLREGAEYIERNALERGSATVTHSEEG